MFTELEIEKIEPNPYQPRTLMNEEKLEEISNSILHLGIIQPLIVREYNGAYQLIAGERRYRGAMRAGMKKVPVVIKNVTDEEMLGLALIENMHREDLSPVDKANGFKDLIDKFNMTQKRISEIFSISRPAIANTLRLLDLEDDIKEALHRKNITEGHARALLAIRDTNARKAALKRIVSESLTVREAEDLSKTINRYYKNGEYGNGDKGLSVNEQRLIEDLRMKLGAKVQITKEKGIGKIVIEFYDDEDLERIVEKLL